MIKYLVIRNFRGTCSSVEMLKGYMHGSRKDFFQGGALGDFSKVFLGGPEGVKFNFSQSKLRKHPFLLKFSKTEGAWPPAPLPTPMGTCLSFEMLKGYMVRERLGTPVLGQGFSNQPFP